jgi:hypothetical protein
MKQIFLTSLLLFLLVGCASPTPSPVPYPTIAPKLASGTPSLPTIALTPSPTPITDLAPYFKDNTLKPIEVKIQDSSLGTAGKLISAMFRNDSREYRNFSLTCGYTFSPKNNNKIQQMILIQSLEFSMEPLGWLTVNPVTVCTEPDKEVPAYGEYYVFGPMAEGDLKKLADCVCKSVISPDDNITLFTQQLAFWMVAWGKSPANLITMSPDEFLKLLDSKNVDQETIDSFRDYLPLVKIKTVAILSQCGF